MKNPVLNIDLPDKSDVGKKKLDEKEHQDKGRKMLNESTGTKSVDIVHKVINKMGWK